MDTEIRNNTQQYKDDEIVLDLRGLLGDYARCLKRYWLQLFLVLFIITTLAVAYFNITYEPVYIAKIAYAVEKTEDPVIDAAIAKRLSLSISTVASLKEFREEMINNITENSINENYEISSSNTENSNLFTVYINSNNYKNSNILLENFKEIFPKWAYEIVGSAEVQITDESIADKEPVNPYFLFLSAAKGFIGGIIVCFIIATIYAFSTKVVQRESDMRKITIKNCIAIVADVKLKKHMNNTREQLLISNRRVDWGFKQSILAAQARIERQMEKENKKVLLVSSTIPDEGKSILSINIAQAFEMREKKVLIIDGDFRNPTVGKRLGIDKECPGLSDYFKKKISLDKIIQTKENLDIICAGTVRGGASSILPEKDMRALMENLINWYDYIIMDTPPSSLFADGAILSEYADAVIYVVRHDKATVKEIRDGIEPYIRSDKLLGYIINRKPGGYSSYGKYGRYGGYKRYEKYKKYVELNKETMNTEDSL